MQSNWNSYEKFEEQNPNRAFISNDLPTNPQIEKNQNIIINSNPDSSKLYVCTIQNSSILNFEENNRKVKEDKNNSKSIIEKFYCNPCNLSLLSAAQLEQHLSGKKHMKKINSNLNKKNEFRCDLCEMNMISETQLKSHFSGKKHLKKIASISPNVSDSVKPTKRINDDRRFEQYNIAWDKYKISEQLRQETQNKYDFYCFLCNKYLQKKLQLVDHLKSKKHHRKIHIQRLKAQEMKEFNYLNDQLTAKASIPSLDQNKLNHIFPDSNKRKTEDFNYPKSKKYFTETDSKKYLNKGNWLN